MKPLVNAEEGLKWRPKNPTSTPPFGPRATSSMAAWMPASYKDYVLFMLFIKYITDRYGNSNDFAPPVTIPKGLSFKDMIALKGKSDIGDKINTQIIQPLIDANTRLARIHYHV
jgi:hypothetical protein